MDMFKRAKVTRKHIDIFNKQQLQAFMAAKIKSLEGDQKIEKLMQLQELAKNFEAMLILDK